MLLLLLVLLLFTTISFPDASKYFPVENNVHRLSPLSPEAKPLEAALVALLNPLDLYELITPETEYP